MKYLTSGTTLKILITGMSKVSDSKEGLAISK